MNEKVAVIMSTYNGEEFLEEQIDSILAQRNVEVELYVRDDGSSDRTVVILRDYAKQGRLNLFEGKNCGVGNSFMELLYTLGNSCDYFAFSDQDDIWMPDKLYCAVAAIRNQKIPALYTGNQTLTDRTGKKLGIRYEEIPSTDYHQILCGNLVSGCTMVFNRELYCLLRDEKRRPSCELLQNRIHDVWVAMVASVTGAIFFDQESHILYRQHERNVVGAGKKKPWSRVKEIAEKVRRPEQRCGRSWLAREICRCFPEFICDRSRDLQVYGYYKENVKYRLKLLRNSELRQFSHETWVGLAVKVILGLF